MFTGLRLTELLLIFGLVFLFFGAKRIPLIARGLGEGIRNFKTSVKEPERLEKGEAPAKDDAGSE
jgi:sec-independent protein translocase protein TatA